MTVVVVGAGINGLAAARALARRGRRVRVLERFRLGHARGSSHGRSRIFRLSYPEQDDVRLAQRALGLWRELEREAGQELLVTTGSLDSGPFAAEHEATLTACGVPTERLDAREVRRRFAIALPDGALLQPDGGLLLADRCVEAFAAGARTAGAEVDEETTATGLAGGADGVRVETSSGPIDADAVVVTAGAWASPLLATAGIELDAVATRETVLYLRTATEHTSPPLIAQTPTGRMAYALAAPGIGLKAGFHQAGSVTDPDETGVASSSLAEDAARWARSVYGDAEPTEAETCLYTNRPGNVFALERHGRIVVGSACSGHGFKFAPTTGERLADLAEEVLP